MATSDKARDVNEKPAQTPAISHGDVYGAPGSTSHTTPPDAGRAATEAQVKAGTLPPLKIDDHSSRHWYSGALAVTEDLAKGAYNEVTQHPGRLLENAAIGAAVGIGVALATPEIAIGAAVAGVGYAGYQVYENGSNWMHATGTVANETGHTPAEIAAAHATVEGLGAGAADIAAGVAGGALGNIGTRALIAKFKPAVPEVAATTAAAKTAAGARPEATATSTATGAHPEATATSTATGAHTEAAATSTAQGSAVRPEVANPLSTTQTASTAHPEVGPTVPSVPTAAARPEVATPVPPKPPSLYNKPTIYDRPSENPFTRDETSISLAHPDLWNSLVDKNGTNAYGAMVMRFANDWASAMEKRMAAGEPLSKTMIMNAANDKDSSYVSGAMAGQVENLLSQTWKYGPEFLKIQDAPRTPTS